MLATTTPNFAAAAGVSPLKLVPHPLMAEMIDHMDKQRKAAACLCIGQQCAVEFQPLFFLVPLW
jgi:hypothetical protein